MTTDPNKSTGSLLSDALTHVLSLIHISEPTRH